MIEGPFGGKRVFAQCKLHSIDNRFTPLEYHQTINKLNFKGRQPTKSEDVTFDDLALRSHSIRNFNPQEIVYATKNSEGGKREGRDFVEYIESGRFEPMLKESHKFFRALDRDERKLWADMNPYLMSWVGVWGWLEDLIWFQDIQKRINGVQIE